MIVPEYLWSYSPVPSQVVWDDEMSLFGDYVLGSLSGIFLCLERGSGNQLWQKKISGRPNRIKGLQGNVIVATEFRCSDGPWSADFGIYGISLDTQKLLWTSHAPGRWGRFIRILDFVPDFTNEFRDTPLLVRENQIVTQSGRILDVNTGKDIGKLEMTPELRNSLYNPTTHLIIEKYLDCGEIGTLYAGTPEQPEKPHVILTWSGKPLQLYLKDKSENISWQLDTSQLQEIGEHGYISFKYLKPYIYLLISDQPFYAPVSHDEVIRFNQLYKPISRNKSIKSKLLNNSNLSNKGIWYNPAFFTLWALDVRTGQIVQKVPINKKRAILGQIVDGDDTNLLLRYFSPDQNHYTLLNFARDKIN